LADSFGYRSRNPLFRVHIRLEAQGKVRRSISQHAVAAPE
jgi:hypothetical protein